MRLSCVWLSGALVLALAGCNSPTPAPAPLAPKAASTVAAAPVAPAAPAVTSTAGAASLSAPPVVLDKNQTGLPEGTQRALDETKAVEATLNQKYPKIQIDGMRRIRLGDTVVYEFRGSGVIGYTDEHVNYLMVGGDLISGVGDQAVNLTRQHLAEQAQALTAPANATSAPAAPASSTSTTATNPVTAPPVAEPSTASTDPSATAIVAGLPFERMLKFTYGKGERFLVVFTDPDCPYCQALEKQFTQMGDALNATVYVMPYPLTNLHPDADKKARYLWCTAHPDQSWREWMNNPADWTSFASIHPSTPNCPAAANVDVAVALGKKLGFSATPTILFKNGMVWSGLASADELQKSFAYVVQHPNGIPTQPAPSAK